jgi:CMP-N,N'-diacetyllegionaminic acid synthase
LDGLVRTPRALGVIPARGGSKRLPRKNVLEVAGHPLIAHTIMAAAAATALTDWLVTSEDAEIIEVAKRYGAPVPFVRPDELAGDDVRNIDTVRHALDFMEDASGEPYDMVVLLQPTCPVRDPEHINQAVALLSLSPLDTLASVKGPYEKRDPILKGIRDGVLEGYCGGADTREAFYLFNASIYAAKRDYFIANGKLISDRQVPLLMDQMHSADVDTEADLMVAAAYLDYLASHADTKETRS